MVETPSFLTLSPFGMLGDTIFPPFSMPFWLGAAAFPGSSRGASCTMLLGSAAPISTHPEGPWEGTSNWRRSPFEMGKIMWLRISYEEKWHESTMLGSGSVGFPEKQRIRHQTGAMVGNPYEKLWPNIGGKSQDSWSWFPLRKWRRKVLYGRSSFDIKHSIPWMSLETGSPFMAVQPHSPEGFHPPFLGPPRDPAVAKRSSRFIPWSSHIIVRFKLSCLRVD